MPCRPILRYHGGKWRLAPWIISHFPAHRVYVEPFGGGASVLLRKPRTYAEVYNDLDGDVVNVFRVLRDPDQAVSLQALLRLTPFAREEFEGLTIPADCPVERARRTVARAFMGFGSAAYNSEYVTGFRRKSFRSGTSPAWDWRNYPDHLAAFAERLQGVAIENAPALEVIQAMDREDVLFYVDPPYVDSTRVKRVAGQKCYRFEMTDDEHRELAAVLQEIKGMAVVSGYRCQLYDELYAGWRRVDCRAYADKASPRTESLWISPRAQAATQHRLLDLQEHRAPEALPLLAGEGA